MSTHFTGTNHTIFNEEHDIRIPVGIKEYIIECLNKEGLELTGYRNKPKNTNITILERLLLITQHLHNTYRGFQTYERDNTYQGYIKENIIIDDTELFIDSEIYLEMWCMMAKEYVSKMIYIDVKDTKWYFEFLIKYNIIKKIEDPKSYKTDDGFTTDGRKYAISTVIDKVSETYTLRSDKLIGKIREVRYINHINFLNNPIYKKLIDTITRYSFPTIEYVEQIARQMVKNKAMNKKGKRYVMEYKDGDYYLKYNKKTKTYTRWKSNENICSIQDCIDIYRRFLSNGFCFTYINNHTRYYTSYSLLPSWIRELILIDGKAVIENDYTALHNRILNKLFEDYNLPTIIYLTGDSHTQLANLFFVTRQEAKTIGLSYWNSRIVDNKTIASKSNKSIFEFMDIMLQTYYPKHWDKLVEWKKKDHRNMSVMLMREERKLMDVVVANYVGDEPYIYCYDCIYTTKNIKNEMESLIK